MKPAIHCSRTWATHPELLAIVKRALDEFGGRLSALAARSARNTHAIRMASTTTCNSGTCGLDVGALTAG